MDHTSSAPVVLTPATQLGRNMLIWAAKNGHTAIVTALLSSIHFDATTLNAVTPFGETTLILAARNGHTAIVTALISSAYFDATTLNAKNQFGETALIWAAFNGHTTIVAALIASAYFDATTLNTTDQDDQTALMWATRNGQNEVAFSLLNSMSPQAIVATRPNLSFIDHVLRRAPVISPIEASYNQALALLRQGFRNIVNTFNKEARRPNLGAVNGLMSIIAGYYAPNWCLNPNREMRLVLREIRNPVIFSRTSNVNHSLWFAFNRLTNAAESPAEPPAEPPAEKGPRKKPGNK